MATTSTTAEAKRDPTFRNYTPAQATQYAAGRSHGYPPAVFRAIWSFHQQSSSSSFSRALDVGCGPGNATRDIAAVFDHATGLDPGLEMIATAKSMRYKTKSGEDVRFAVCAAEEIADRGLELEVGLEEGGVDLITVGTAAHWFQMPQFYTQAARLLKPGGTLAIWTVYSTYIHPSEPHAAELQSIISTLYNTTLAPYDIDGNRISRSAYQLLPLPFSPACVSVNPSLPLLFPEKDFVRHEWDRDAVLSNGKTFFGYDEVDSGPRGLGPEMSIERLEQGLETASTVTRWKAAHPELVGSEERDVVKIAMRKLREVLARDGEERKTLAVGLGTVMLLFRRASNEA